MMKKKLSTHVLLLSLWVGSVLLSGGVSFAQEDASAAEAEDSSPVQLEQIVVTSQKTESTRQEVSSNVSVFDGYTLEDMGTNTIEQIVGLTPNISFYRPDNRVTYLVYRGIGGTTNMNKAFNINYDGVTIPYVALNTSLDIERIEMLRGSQSSLYGSNSHAGVLNIVTRRPGDTFEGYAKIGYGSFNDKTFHGAFGGPAGDNVKYRLALGYNQGDGYFTNTYLDRDDGNEHEQFSGNAKFIFDTGGAGELTLGILADTFDDGLDSAVAGSGHDTRHNNSGYNDGSLISPTLTWKTDIGGIALTSITNYSNSNYGFLVDWDHTPQDVYLFGFDEIYNTVTEELRLEGGNGGNLKWLGGLFLMGETLDTDGDLAFGADSTMPGAFQRQDSSVDTFESALFGNVTYRFMPTYEATAGLRLDYTYKDMDWKGTSSFASTSYRSFDDSWLAALPSASLAWVPEETQRVYVSVSRGFKAGDFNNVQLSASLVTEPVDPEYTTTYETGYKGIFADNRIELDLALFYIDWEDMQVDTPLEGSTNMFVKQNAAEAHSSGVELEVRTKLARGVTAFLGAGYMFEFEFDEFTNSSQGDLSGKELPATNEYNVTGGFTWRHDTGLFLSSNVRLYGPKYFDEANQYKEDTYIIADAKLGYEAETWSFTLYGRNLLDEKYAVSISAGRSAETSGEPLVAGAEFNYFF